jgi:hypothetical protein
VEPGEGRSVPSYNRLIPDEPERRAVGKRHATLAEVLAKFAGHLRGAIVAEQPRSVLHANLLAAGLCGAGPSQLVWSTSRPYLGFDRKRSLNALSSV